MVQPAQEGSMGLLDLRVLQDLLVQKALKVCKDRRVTEALLERPLLDHVEFRESQENGVSRV